MALSSQRFIRAALLAVVCLGAPAVGTDPNGFPNSLGRTPPRGVRTWNSVRLNVNQTFVASQAQGLAAPLPGGGSLLAAGFSDVGLDDGWEACGQGVNGSYHDQNGNPLVNSNFPDIRGMTAAARALGVTSSWYMNCCGCPAEHKLSEPHYAQDSAATAAYGFSGLKVDGCGNEPNMVRACSGGGFL
jgi:alpha-galactosidase